MFLPSTRQLQYLLALHEHQHFGRAATATFVTQSTLSAGIADLEKLLGVMLVERTKRTVRFTSVGEDVVERARTVINGAEDLCETARASSQPLSGPIRMAAIPTVAPFLLPQILPAIGEQWPDLQLFVREMLTTAACEALHRGTIDCVLLALPTDCGDTETFEIGIDRLMLATSNAADDPASVPIHPDDIDVTRLLLLEDGHCLKDHALAACDSMAASSKAMLVASTLHTIVQLVDAGLGTTLLPEMAIKAGILSGTGVRSHALLAQSAERRIALAWRRGSARGPDYRLFGATIRKAVSF